MWITNLLKAFLLPILHRRAVAVVPEPQPEPHSQPVDPDPELQPQQPSADIHPITIMGSPAAAKSDGAHQPAATHLLLADDDDDDEKIVRNHNTGFWIKLIVVFCLESAIEIVVLHVQTSTPQRSLPLTVYLFSLSILFAFTSFFVSKLIDSNKFASAVRQLEGVGVFFGVTAFFMAITAPFPLFLACIAWTLYAVSVLLTLIYKLLFARRQKQKQQQKKK